MNDSESRWSQSTARRLLWAPYGWALAIYNISLILLTAPVAREAQKGKGDE
jgi:hypothetical protein